MAHHLSDKQPGTGILGFDVQGLGASVSAISAMSRPPKLGVKRVVVGGVKREKKKHASSAADSRAAKMRQYTKMNDTMTNLMQEMAIEQRHRTQKWVLERITMQKQCSAAAHTNREMRRQSQSMEHTTQKKNDLAVLHALLCAWRTTSMHKSATKKGFAAVMRSFKRPENDEENEEEAAPLAAKSEIHPFDYAVLCAAFYSWKIHHYKRHFLVRLKGLQNERERMRCLAQGCLLGWRAVMLKLQAYAQAGVACFQVLPPAATVIEFIPRGPMRRNLFHRVCASWLVKARRQITVCRVANRNHVNKTRDMYRTVFNAWYYFSRWLMVQVYVMIAKYQSGEAREQMIQSTRTGPVAHFLQKATQLTIEADKIYHEALVGQRHAVVSGCMRKAWAKARHGIPKADEQENGEEVAQQRSMGYDLNPGAHRGKHPSLGFHTSVITCFNNWRRMYMMSTLHRQFVSRKKKLEELREHQENMWTSQTKELEAAIKQQLRLQNLSEMPMHRLKARDNDSVYSVEGENKFLSPPAYNALI